MVTIKMRCNFCAATAKLDPADVRLHICSEDPDFSFVAFTCPACGKPVIKHATAVTIGLLKKDAGLVPKAWSGPSWHDPWAPVIGDDDLIAFGAALEAEPCPVSELAP